MASTLAWLDSSLREQRRVREILRLFTIRDSRDEMGIGQIRDVFSDLLFPGTSVLHTRARYLLFVPWCEQVGGERAERRLVATLLTEKETEGLIGSRSGPAVQNLPSTIYRAALLRWGILDETAVDVDAEHADDGDVVRRGNGRWHHELPPAPAGFPGTVAGGFALGYDEADWLRQRILTSEPDSMLAHMLRHPAPPAPEARHPWDDPVCSDAPGELARALGHARLFSTVMHGALLLYNLMLARQYEDLGHTKLEDRAQHYESALAEWRAEVDADRWVASWSLDDLWDLVLGANPRIGAHTRDFVTHWVGIVRGSDPVDSADPRQLVREREELLKKKQSRFRNEKMLAGWNGASGARRMAFRWGQAHRLVTDIRTGLEGPGAAA